MRVKEILTGKILDVNASYGARLIEQGRAVLAKKEPETAPAPAAKKGSKKAVTADGAD